MSIAKKFYEILIDVLLDEKELVPGASLRLQDRTIAAYFNIAESTARNWRRGRNMQVSSSLGKAIIGQCTKLDSSHVEQLEFLLMLTEDAREIKLAAEYLVDELLKYVITDDSTWHVYSGPLKIAYTDSLTNNPYHRILHQTAHLTEHILTLGLDREDIPCIGELVRYSSHGWFHLGYIKLREQALSSPKIGVNHENISRIEKALYYGDLCASTAYFLDDPTSATHYVTTALQILNDASITDEKFASMSAQDARGIIRSIDVMQRCYYPHLSGNTIIFQQFMAEYNQIMLDSSFASAKQYEALGYIELCHHNRTMEAADYFAQASTFAHKWFADMQIPLDSVLEACLKGYALLQSDGPTTEVQAILMSALVQIKDFEIVTAQIPARMSLAAYSRQSGEEAKAIHQIKIAENVARQIDLHSYYRKCQNIFVN